MVPAVGVIAADMAAGHQPQQACAGPKPVVVKGPAGEAEAAKVAILLAQGHDESRPYVVAVCTGYLGYVNRVIARQVEMVSPGVQSVHVEVGGV